MTTTTIRRTIAALALATAGFFATTTPASAATQSQVKFQVASFHCSRGVYDVVKVLVTADVNTFPATSINADWQGSSRGDYVKTDVKGIPAGGGKGLVTVGYRCKTIFGLPSFATAVSTYRWFYGSGIQPTVFV